MSSNPGAMQLRTLQTMAEIARTPTSAAPLVMGTDDGLGMFVTESPVGLLFLGLYS